MEKNKILFITVRADIGGGPKHVLDILKTNHPIERFIAAPDKEFYSSSFKNYSKGFIPIPHRKFSLKALIHLYLFCKKENITIVHSHGFGAGIYSRLLKIIYPKIKVIHTFHGVHPGQKAKNILEKILSTLTYKLIFVSQSEFENATNLGICNQDASNWAIMPHGIDIDFFKEKLKEAMKLNLPWKEKKIKILGTLSRLDEHKGNHYLILNMKKLPPHFKMVVAGDGPRKNDLLKLIKEEKLENRVLLLGELDSPFSLLKSIDIYVSSSKGEGLPYAILESMAAEKPMVISKVSGHLNLGHKEQFFSLENPEEYTAKILKAAHYKNVKYPILNSNYDLNKNLVNLFSLYE